MTYISEILLITINGFIFFVIFENVNHFVLWTLLFSFSILVIRWTYRHHFFLALAYLSKGEIIQLLMSFVIFYIGSFYNAITLKLISAIIVTIIFMAFLGFFRILKNNNKNRQSELDS